MIVGYHAIVQFREERNKKKLEKKKKEKSQKLKQKQFFLIEF